mmetsp:Transcript_34828/g.54440  ORF Transcript_34828/g.54440 Transcript_34828/m.54440 type:complete len:310 (+) Transcript_34828:146-1075(+)
MITGAGSKKIEPQALRSQEADEPGGQEARALGSQEGKEPVQSAQLLSPSAAQPPKPRKHLSKSPKIAQGPSVFGDPKRQAAFKASDTPYAFSWPLLSKPDRELVIQRVAKLLEPLRKEAEAKRSFARISRLKTHRVKQIQVDEQSGIYGAQNRGTQGEERSGSEGTEGAERGNGTESEAGEPGARALRGWVCVGLNEVTRALEKGELSAVIVCKDPQPKFLVQHLPPAAALGKALLCAIGETSEGLGRLLGAPSAVAIGFRRNPRLLNLVEHQIDADLTLEEQETEHHVTSVVQFLASKTPKLEIPWIF